jgi:hypothetical protein
MNKQRDSLKLAKNKIVSVFQVVIEIQLIECFLIKNLSFDK